MLFSFSRHRRERRIFFCSPCLPFPSRRLQRKEKKKYLLLPICAQADLRKRGGCIRHFLLHLRIFFLKHTCVSPSALVLALKFYRRPPFSSLKTKQTLTSEQTENQSLLSPTTTTVCLSPFLSRPLCIMFSFPHIQNRLLTSSPSSSFLFSSFLSASFPSPFSPAPAALHKFAWKERARLLLRRRPLLPLPSLETHRGRRKRKEKDLLLQPPTYLPYPKDTTLLRAWDSTIVTKNRLGKYYIKLVAHICTKTTFFI